MKTKILFFLLVFFLCAAFLSAEFFEPDDDEIIEISHLSRVLGKALPFASFPVHGSDLLMWAEKLAALPKAESLGDADREMLDGLIDRLSADSGGGVAVKGNLALAFEYRYESSRFTIDKPSDPDNPQTPGVANAEDFRRAFLDWTPPLSFGAEGGTFNGIWVGAQFEFRPPWDENYEPFMNFFDKVDIAYDIMTKGILAWNGKWLNLFAGRDSIHWGDPASSSLYPAKTLPYLDSVRMNVPLGPFSFDYFLATTIPKKAVRDVYDIYPVTGTPDSDDYLEQGIGFLHDETTSVILIAGHRFGWNFGRFKVGAGGTIVYVRPNNAFHITDFLPFIVYHNADVAPNNLAMILDASWAVWRGLSLSAMVGFDDISARSFGIPDGDIPTIPGAVVGADYSLPLAGNAATGKIFMNLHLEGGYTHYLWGNFHYDDPPFDDPAKPKLLLPKAIYRYAPNHSAVVYPLTSPYGPGAVWAAFAADFTFPERSLRAGLDFLFLTKNSEVNLVDTVYSIDDATKDSPRVYYCALSLPAVYTWRWFDFSFAPGFRLLAGPGGVKDASFEFTVGVRFGMEGKKRFAGPY